MGMMCSMELITREDAASRARVSVKTIARWQRHGKLSTHERRVGSGQVGKLVDAAELAPLIVEPADCPHGYTVNDSCPGCDHDQELEAERLEQLP